MSGMNKLRNELAEKEGSPYHETSEARVLAFKNGWDACLEKHSPIEPEGLPDQKDEGWKYDYDFIRSVKIKINETYGENPSMEEVEAVLLAINYKSEPSPLKDEGLNPIIIFDVINKWANDRDRETIPRKAFLEIAKEIVKIIPPPEPSSKEQEGDQDGLWDEVRFIAQGYIYDAANSRFETDLRIGGASIEALKLKFIIKTKTYE